MMMSQSQLSHSMMRPTRTSLSGTARTMTYNRMANTSSQLFYLSSSFCVLISAIISLTFITQVGPFRSSPSSYHGTQIMPHPHHHQSSQTKSSLDKSTHNRYAIVFDGGSTGTRIHIFLFGIQNDSNSNSRTIYLEKEVFHYVNPGISFYASNPSDAALSLRPLMEAAMQEVPHMKAKDTSVIFKATAGLRLLPQDSANEILNSIEAMLVESPFKVDSSAVSMLDDLDEGIFAWYTVNFLKARLHEISSSFVTLDMGGGSTQITFATQDTQTLVRSPKGFIIKRDIEAEPEYLYTHSYLGSGLMSSRKAILLTKRAQPTVSSLNETVISIRNHPCFAYPQSANDSQTYHESEKWFFEGMDYEIMGERMSEHSFEECYQIAKGLVANAIHKPEEIKSRQIYAMSYFYDRMLDSKVIKPQAGKDGTKGGVIKVKDYLLTAENICKSVIRLRKQSAFLCLDLTYLAALLHDGYGLGWNKEITLVKKINGIETSWALGAALNLLDFNQNESR